MLPSNTKAVIFSCEGCALLDEERSFFSEAQPLGFILFARNCESPMQVWSLTEALRSAVGWKCPILIDQEGGRVQRLKPPVWRKYPAMREFAEKPLEDLRFTVLQMAEELLDAGISVNCAPVLDVLTEATHDAIGDRAFSDDPDIVSDLGLSFCRNLLATGIIPVIKHLPGHGRAAVDSHKDLPRVDASLEALQATDFKPFRDVSSSEIGDAVWGMVAHIVYTAIDADLPSSASPAIIDLIRNDIGFDGVLLSDDLDMDALDGLGDVAARTLAVLDAGCDVALYCSGKLEDMQAIAESVPNLTAKAQERLQLAQKSLKVEA